uniref:Transcription initiation factor IIA gamma chain n=1 Tax=Sus scrofa TaxID=9823 RepID=A0A8D1NUV1_PIG
MAYQLYRNTTLGKSLQESLDELKQSQQITPQLALQVLLHCEKAINSALAQRVRNSQFQGLHLEHMDVPRLDVDSELQLPTYSTARATWNPSHVCDLQHSSRQRQILNPLSEARDRTCILMDPSRVH